jgi:hypothetical protein
VIEFLQTLPRPIDGYTPFGALLASLYRDKITAGALPADRYIYHACSIHHHYHLISFTYSVVVTVVVAIVMLSMIVVNIKVALQRNGLISLNVQSVNLKHQRQ